MRHNSFQEDLLQIQECQVDYLGHHSNFRVDQFQIQEYLNENLGHRSSFQAGQFQIQEYQDDFHDYHNNLLNLQVPFLNQENLVKFHHILPKYH